MRFSHDFFILKGDVRGDIMGKIFLLKKVHVRNHCVRDQCPNPWTISIKYCQIQCQKVLGGIVEIKSYDRINYSYLNTKKLVI